jgi:hypothetical protein
MRNVCTIQYDQDILMYIQTISKKIRIIVFFIVCLMIELFFISIEREQLHLILFYLVCSTSVCLFLQK